MARVILTRSSYTHELLQQLVKVDLIDLAFALELDPSLANHPGSNSIQFDANADAESTVIANSFPDCVK